MTISTKNLRQYLQKFELKLLFIEELGWNNYTSRIRDFQLDGTIYKFKPVAEQGGMVIITCEASDGNIPSKGARGKIDKYITQLAFEHIIIFVDSDKSTSLWLWIKHEDGKSKHRTHTYRKGQLADALLQKLAGIAFEIDELDDEGKITISTVTNKVSQSFDKEPVIKKFYGEFKNEHSHFLKFLQGIQDEAGRDWYASVMLNRLMFLYFIQQKRFLNREANYLQQKLEAIDATGKSYYHDFLLTLFFEGLACEKDERTVATNQLLGRIPYLNGGLFLPHPIEDKYGNEIEIPNEAFTRLFRFFDSWDWHLDVREHREGNEINPDVLGYIFEKYINQKEMGAYYTQEDITEYICKNTILPFLLEKAGVDVKAVMNDVEPYIYEAVSTDEYLPTETEREYTARRQRYEQIKADFSDGKIANINDLITYNLDIIAFTEDWLHQLDDPSIVGYFYFECLTKITVLDPTCGSGAFLFAAMNILEPLYELILDKMKRYADPVKYRKFFDELNRMNSHSNRKYFVYKSIIINNLYGVDIMPEAVEICKLRLFLKLVAEINDVERIEPLPDIDFNIRAGNTLVGFATQQEIHGRLFATDELKEKVANADRALTSFRDLQTNLGVKSQVFKQAKKDIEEQLEAVRKYLDESLMEDYGQSNLEDFRESHQPFHWYLEFNHVLTNGGFDVIIGNPPYVSTKKVDYLNKEQKTKKYSDIYGHVISKSLDITQQSRSRLSMIVPLSITFSMDFSRLREEIAKNGGSWFSSYDNIPAAIFDGVSQRCTIWLHQKSQHKWLQTAPMVRWRSDYRSVLMNRIEYARFNQELISSLGIPKFNNTEYGELIEIIAEASNKYGRYPFPKSSQYKVGFSQAARNFISVFLKEPPCLDADSLQPVPTSKIGYVNVTDETAQYASLACLLGEIYFWYWLIRGDGFDVTSWIITDFLVGLQLIDKEIIHDISQIGEFLHHHRYKALSFKKNAGKFVGNYNYRSLFNLTRRADLLLLMGFGFNKENALSILNYVQRVLSINVYAGEKSIPHTVKAKFPPLLTNEEIEKSILTKIDTKIRKHYGFTEEELDFIINYDINYHISTNDDNGNEEE